MGRSLADSKSLLGSLLLGQSHLLLVSSLHVAGLLSDMELDVAVGGKVGGDSSVSSVSSPSSLHSSLGADVGDLALLDIQALGLSVGLEVLEEVEDVLDGLLGPSTVVVVHVLAHGMSARAAGVSSEGHDALVSEDSLHVTHSFHQVHSSHGAGSLVCVLVMRSQIVHSAFSRYTTLEKNPNLTTFPSESPHATARAHGPHCDKGSWRERKECLHLESSAGCLEYLTIANL